VNSGWRLGDGAEKGSGTGWEGVDRCWVTGGESALALKWG